MTIEKSIFFTQKGEKNGKSADILETKFVNPTKGEKELNFISQKKIKMNEKVKQEHCYVIKSKSNLVNGKLSGVLTSLNNL